VLSTHNPRVVAEQESPNCASRRSVRPSPIRAGVTVSYHSRKDRGDPVDQRGLGPLDDSCVAGTSGVGGEVRHGDVATAAMQWGDGGERERAAWCLALGLPRR
jgi:hypothetical protein